jgi:hypothetical protein
MGESATHPLDNAPSDRRACSACVHARRVMGPTLYCNRSAALHPCDDERSYGGFAAMRLGACGLRGRFFAPAPPADTAALGLA